MIVSTKCSRDELKYLGHDKIITEQDMEEIFEIIKGLDSTQCLKISMGELSPSSTARLYKHFQKKGVALTVKNSGVFRYLWVKNDKDTNQ